MKARASAGSTLRTDRQNSAMWRTISWRMSSARVREEGAAATAELLLIPPHDPAPVTVGAPAEEDPADPPVQDVRGGRRDGLHSRPLRLALHALDERHGDLLDGGAPPPDLEQAFGIGEGAFALELHRLDQGARVHRHVLIVAQGEPEEEADEQVVGDGHHCLAEVIGALGEEPERRNGSEADTLEHLVLPQ